MKFKTLLLLLGIIMSHSLSFAQKKEFKFGKIDPSEFQIKASGEDSAAAAIKIFDVGNCSFQLGSNGFVYVFERHFRIKILNKNGYDYANYKIGLFRGNNGSKEEMYGMEAATYNLVDGKMVVSKLGKDAKFSEEFNKQYTYKKFALPNVKEGSIIEFKFSIKSDFIFNLRGWSFQSEIPTLHTEYNVVTPNYFIYKKNFSGVVPVKQTKHQDLRITLGQFVGDGYLDQYVLDSVPALKDESYITTLDDYRPALDFELMATQFPSEPYRDYNGSWPKIVTTLSTDENFGAFINKNAYAKSILPGLLKGEKDSLAIVKLIFNYVKSNVKWNDDYNLYASGTNPKAVFEKKSGSSSDINLSLISLLKEAKIEVNPVLVSTRENGAHAGYPVITKFNNVIAQITIGPKSILLDATERDMPLGMIAYQNLNHQVLVVDLNALNAKWLMNEPVFDDERIYSYNLTLDKENKLKGTITQYSRGYAALNLRDKYRTTNSETEFLKDFKKNKTGLELSNYKITNLDEIDELLTETMGVVIEDNVEEAGNLIYFTPMLFEKTKENPFKHDKRLFDVDFGHPIKETYRITVNFPEDYEIDKLPKSAVYQLPDRKGSFSITFLNEGKTLMVRSVININKTMYAPEEYFDLKELFKAIVQKQAEQIVFKKKA